MKKTLKAEEKKKCCKGMGKKCLPVHNELDRLKPICLYHLYWIFAILWQLLGEIFITVLGTCLLSFLFFLLKIVMFLFLVNFLLPPFVTCSSFLDNLNYFLSKQEGIGSFSSGPYNQWNFSPVLKVLPPTSPVLLIDMLRLRHCNWPFSC